MRRIWLNIWSAFVIALTSVVAPSQGQFAYATNTNDNTVNGYTIDSVTGSLSAMAGSPLCCGALSRFRGGGSERQVRLRVE
jgi:hypothetical protein